MQIILMPNAMTSPTASSSFGQQKKYKYIFLDLDDTIWDFHANSKAAVRTIYHQQKLNRYYSDFEVYYRKYAIKNTELWTQYGLGLISKQFLIEERFDHLLREAGINDRAWALKMNEAYLETLSVQTQLKPFARTLLNLCLSQERPMTIVSNGFTEVQYRKLKAARIEHYFSHIVLSEVAGALKPDPTIFHYALNLNNARADETLMIGDSYEADIAGAIAVGMDALYLNNHNQLSQLPLPPQVTPINSLAQAVDFLT